MPALKKKFLIEETKDFFRRKNQVEISRMKAMTTF